MKSSAKTPAEYMKGLPAERRAELEAVRQVILKNLDDGYEESMQYGMIGYTVPHRVYPAGYHVDPKKPLFFAGLASQKNGMALHFPAAYLNAEQDRWFREAWTKSGKRLDMGKGCVRFRKVADVPLDVVAKAFKRLPAKKYVKLYVEAIASRKKK
jgi:hypothetical protein